MKKIILVLFFSFISLIIFSQCSWRPQYFWYKIEPINTEYSLLYSLDIKYKKYSDSLKIYNTFSLNLVKGNYYVFHSLVPPGFENRNIIELFQNNELLINSKMVNSNNQSFVFKCNTTGKYILHAYQEKNDYKKGCAGVLIGFKSSFP